MEGLCPATEAAGTVEASAAKLAQMLEKVAQRTADCRVAVQRMAADLVAEQAVVEGSLSSTLEALAAVRSCGRALARIPAPTAGSSSSERPSTRAARAERFSRSKVSASVAASEASLKALHDEMDAQRDRCTAISFVAAQRVAELEQSCAYAEDNVAALIAVQTLVANIGVTNRGNSGVGKPTSKAKSKAKSKKSKQRACADAPPRVRVPPTAVDIDARAPQTAAMPPRPTPPRTRTQRTAVTIG